MLGTTEPADNAQKVPNHHKTSNLAFVQATMLFTSKRLTSVLNVVQIQDQMLKEMLVLVYQDLFLLIILVFLSNNVDPIKMLLIINANASMDSFDLEMSVLKHVESMSTSPITDVSAKKATLN